MIKTTNDGSNNTVKFNGVGIYIPNTILDLPNWM